MDNQMLGIKQIFTIVALFFSLIGCGHAEERTKSIDFSKSLVDLPLHKGAWNIETDQKNSPAPTVNFDEGVITISGMKPLENHYPTVGKISDTYTLQIRRFAVKVFENSN